MYGGKIHKESDSYVLLQLIHFVHFTVFNARSPAGLLFSYHLN